MGITSAVTLGAGLGRYVGGLFSSRTPSRSNISVREFDPERKLTDLLAARGGLNVLYESAAFAQNRASNGLFGSKDPVSTPNCLHAPSFQRAGSKSNIAASEVDLFKELLAALFCNFTKGLRHGMTMIAGFTVLRLRQVRIFDRIGVAIIAILCS
jgi:hypothetical protein